MTSHDDTRQKTFADLTALLEDAAGLAADGQAPALTIRKTTVITQRIRALLHDATKTLDQLN